MYIRVRNKQGAHFHASKTEVSNISAHKLGEEIATDLPCKAVAPGHGADVGREVLKCKVKKKKSFQTVVFEVAFELAYLRDNLQHYKSTMSLVLGCW